MKKNLLVLIFLVLGAVSSMGQATVSSITSADVGTTLKVGDVLDITIKFSEAVTVTGTPILWLNLGASSRFATYSGSTTTDLLFQYTVHPDDAASPVDYTNTTALDLNGGTIKGAGDVNADLTLFALGGGSSLSAEAVIVDGIRPTVTNVTATNLDDAYTKDAAIIIEVTFSENVTVAGGNPTLQLETGATDRTATYNGTGSGTTTLEFLYTVQAGDASRDLDYKSIYSLQLPTGVTITDAIGNPADLKLASRGATGSLGANKNILIDTQAPTVRKVTSTTRNGSYKQGDIIDIYVTFSEPVKVIGTPTLTLNSSATAVNYTSGNLTSTLLFRYTVGATDAATDLQYAAITSLTAGTSIQDTALNDANLDLPALATSNSLGGSKALVIDNTPPTVASIEQITIDGTYIIGDTIDIAVEFSEPVMVGGRPKLKLAVGGADRFAFYRSGRGTDSLTFRYKVEPADVSADLNFDGAAALLLNSGSITDRAGNAADLDLTSVATLASTAALEVDGVVPTITSVTSAAANGTYNATDVIGIQVVFSQNVVVDGGTPTLQLETGKADQVVNYTSGSATTTLLFNYTVQANDITKALDVKSVRSLLLNGATIKSENGNPANLQLIQPGADFSLSKNKFIAIDAVAPAISKVSTTTLSGSYTSGDSIDIVVTFTEPVTVAAPQLKINSPVAGKLIDYVDGSGTPNITFRYFVLNTDATADLDYFDVNSFVGTVTDTATNAVVNPVIPFVPGDPGSLSAGKTIVIDCVAPNITGITSPTADATYGIGSSIDFEVTFDKVVYVTGRPRIELATGAVNKYAVYRSGRGTNTLTFTYRVELDDVAADLDYTTTGALTLNGGSITDKAGNVAALTLPAVGTIAGVKALVVDGIPPRVLGVSSTTADGSYNAGDAIVIEIEFDQNITFTDGGVDPVLQLETGGIDRLATFTSALGAVMTFTYTVQAGDKSADLEYRGIRSLVKNEATIEDAVGNNAILTLPALRTTGSGSLADNSGIIIDTQAPTVTNVTSAARNSIYMVGDVIDIDVTFSEVVNFTGTPTLALGTGVNASCITAAGKDTVTLTFRYTVASGHTALDLDYVGTGSLAGSIADIATNAATLDLPAPGARGSLGRNKNIEIDGVAPTSTGITSPTPDGIYGSGSVIYIKVAYSEVVNVAGSPFITLDSGGRAVYLSGSGTNQLLFKYTVKAGESSADLDNSTPIDLNGGSIKDRAGNEASLDIGSLASSSNIEISTAKSSKSVAGSKEVKLPELGITLYPNPSNGIINLSVENIGNAMATANIFDTAGRLVLTQSVEGSEAQLTLDVKPGVYILKLLQGDRVATKRFVIQ